MVQHQRQPNET